MHPNRRPTADALPPLTLVPPVDDPAPVVPPVPDTMAEVAVALLPEAITVRPRHDGWTAMRQRAFLTVLAETGSISLACQNAGMSTRSAYRLRARTDAAAFAQGWDDALKLATTRLTTLAFERATRGTVRETWVNGECVQTTRAPSDKLLMFLLQHLLPAGRPGERWTGFETMAHDARDRFPATLRDLADNDVPIVPLAMTDFYDRAPGPADDES